MGMSTHVTGLREADKKHDAMIQVVLACHQAGIAIPKEVDYYFGGVKPEIILGDPSTGLEVKIKSKHYSDGNACEGEEVLLSDLPENVTRIRFTNCY